MNNVYTPFKLERKRLKKEKTFFRKSVGEDKNKIDKSKFMCMLRV